MKRLFRSRSAKSASDNVSIPSMPPPYQAVEAGTSPSASGSGLTAAPSKPSLAYTPEKTSETSADADPGLRMGYCYYRIYTQEGAVPSKTAFNLRNPYLGRIASSNSQRLALRAGSLFCSMLKDSVKQLACAELNRSYWNAQVPGSAPYGTTPETAFALLLKGVEHEEAVNPRMIPTKVPTEVDPIYLYYRLFTRIGEDTSNVRFNPNDQALGRIEKFLIPPPHTADSIKYQIAKLESKRIYAYAELYTSISAPEPVGNTAYLSLMQDDSPGCKEADPMVLVQPERRPKLDNRPIEVVLAYTVDEWGRRGRLAVGSRGLTDGVLVEKAVFCKLHQNWDSNCVCGQNGSGTRSVTRVFWCTFVLDQISHKTYLPACNIKFLDE
ncbi:hypothetical protein MSAN_02207800 [Mycena sanguinolenta]|uniref:Uncharacterized protein n=1 Tax=Mycena sanguinolenta TaxID=230812 RepID=A0A8H6XDR0_9AGAR|nr:hypothetical protein MSAN_02207800 [Mycena sanguinolenta]